MGATGVEFALVGVPFILLLIGIIEICMMFTTETLLQGGMNNAARMIRTGQIQQMGVNDQETAFRDALCQQIGMLVDCDELGIESINIGSFENAANFPPQFNEDGVFEPAGFDAGGVNDVVLMRVAYNYHMMTPIIAQLFTGGKGSRLMMNTQILQIEPYDFEEAAEDIEDSSGGSADVN